MNYPVEKLEEAKKIISANIDTITDYPDCIDDIVNEIMSDAIVEVFGVDVWIEPNIQSGQGTIDILVDGYRYVYDYEDELDTMLDVIVDAESWEDVYNGGVKFLQDLRDAGGDNLNEAVDNNFSSSELKKLKSLTRRGEDWYGIEWSDALDKILHKSVEAVLGPVDYIEPSTEGGEGTTFAWLENGDVYTWDFSSEADVVYQSIDSAKSWDDVYSAVETFVRTHAEKDEDMSEGDEDLDESLGGGRKNNRICKTAPYCK